MTPRKSMTLKKGRPVALPEATAEESITVYRVVGDLDSVRVEEHQGRVMAAGKGFHIRGANGRYLCTLQEAEEGWPQENHFPWALSRNVAIQRAIHHVKTITLHQARLVAKRAENQMNLIAALLKGGGS